MSSSSRSWSGVATSYYRGTMAEALVDRRLPERLHARRRAGRARRRRDRRARERAGRRPALRAGGGHARLAPAGPRLVRRAGRAVAARTACRTPRARSCTRRSTASRVDVVVDKGQDPGTEGYSGFEATRARASCCASAGVDRLTVVGLATDYCVKNTALDALRGGLRGDGGPRGRCAAWRSRRATPSGRSRRCARPARRSRMTATRRWERMLESMRVVLPRRCGSATDGYRLVELDGVLAMRDAGGAGALAAQLGGLRERGRAGGGARRAGEASTRMPACRPGRCGRRSTTSARGGCSTSAGHVLDANPAAMIADLAEVEPPRPDDPEPDAEPQREDLALINDLAYGPRRRVRRADGRRARWTRVTPTSRALDGERGRMRGDPRPRAATAASGGWPPCRRRAAAASSSGLMRRALADGRERGCEVTTLQATKLGQPVYERLGYRRFGTRSRCGSGAAPPRPRPASRAPRT